MDRYLSLYAPVTYEKVIERSRFIANCAHVEDEEQARAFVSRIRAEHSLATHNCYAYVADRAGNLMRFSDDGEPQGTAGLPMLDVLRKGGLVETAVVVTRYFGGIKLGAGGLVRAYSGTCAEALASGDVREYKMCREIRIFCGYENYDALRKFTDRSGCEMRGTEYTDKVCLKVAVTDARADEFVASLTDYMSGRVQSEKGDCYWHPFRRADAGGTDGADGTDE